MSACRSTFSLLLASLLTLSACGPAKPAAKPPLSSNAIFGDAIADEGDFEGTVVAFQTQLKRLKPSDEKYPQALERLALAHLDLADDLQSQTKAKPAVQKRADSERREAIAQLKTLVTDFPDYEGVAASLFIMSVESISLGEADAAAAPLDELIKRFPETEFALDGLLTRAELATQKKDLTRAEKDYALVVARDAGQSPRSAFAHYQIAGILMGKNKPDAAFLELRRVVNDSAADPELASYAQVVAAHVLAQTDRDEAAAVKEIETLTSDPEAQKKLLAAFKKARQKK